MRLRRSVARRGVLSVVATARRNIIATGARAGAWKHIHTGVDERLSMRHGSGSEDMVESLLHKHGCWVSIL